MKYFRLLIFLAGVLMGAWLMLIASISIIASPPDYKMDCRTERDQTIWGAIKFRHVPNCQTCVKPDHVPWNRGQ